MRKAEYDLLTWKSLPSSAKLTNDEGKGWTYWEQPSIVSVTPGETLTLKFSAKQENVLYTQSIVVVEWFDPAEKRWRWLVTPRLSLGTYDWSNFEETFTIPENISQIRVGRLLGGAGAPEKAGTTWFDNLRVYQDGAPIYENQFTDWMPYIGGGVGAIIGGVAGEVYKPVGPIASPLLGAALGATIGAGIGAIASQPATITTVTIPQIGTTPEQTYIITN